jgi:hypothetical protein
LVIFSVFMSVFMSVFIFVFLSLILSFLSFLANVGKRQGGNNFGA